MASKLKILPSVHDFAVLLGVISLLSVQLISFSNDPGVGWHLKTGELILNGGFPYFDTFLASDIPRAWIADQWLSDVVLFGLFDLGAYPLLYALLSIFFLSLFFWYSWREVRDFTGFSIASTIAVLLAFKIAQIHFILRPVIFSFAFFTFLYFFLLNKSFDKSVFSLKEKLVLFFTFVFWANIHPSFILGFGLFGIYCLNSLFKFPSISRIKELVGLLIILLAATLINPYNYKLLTSILELGSSSYFMHLHQEWQSVSFNTYSGLLFCIVSFVSLLALVFPRNRAKLNLFTVVSFLLFTTLCFSAVRFLPYFAITSLVLFSLSISSLSSLLKEYFKDLLPIITGAFTAAEEYDQKIASKNLALIFASLIILISVVFNKKIPLYTGEFGPTKDKFPYSEVNWIMENSTSDNTVVFAPPRWGGFIIWQSNLNLKPLLDDRNTLVGKDLYKLYFNISKSDYGLSQILKGRKVKYLLAPLGGEISNQASKLVSFKLEYKGELAEVYSAKF